MSVTCLVDSQAVFIRSVLFLDMLLFILYFVSHMKCVGETAAAMVLRKMVSFGLYLTLFLVVVLSYIYYADVPFSPSAQLAGVVTAALFSILELMEKLVMIARLLMGSVILIAAELANTWLPTLMQTNLHMDIQTAEALVLLIPVLAFVAFEISIGSEVFATVFVCATLSILFGLSISVWYLDGLGVSDPVCCDLHGDCPLWWPYWDTYMIVILFILLLYICIKDCLRRTKRCCVSYCCCCCSREKEKKEKKEDEIHQLKANEGEDEAQQPLLAPPPGILARKL
jgi:hypothetical protein